MVSQKVYKLYNGQLEKFYVDLGSGVARNFFSGGAKFWVLKKYHIEVHG